MDKKLTGLMLLFLIMFSSFLGYAIFGRQMLTSARASVESIPSSSDSLIYAWPLTVDLNQSQTSEINVFIRNADKVPIANKQVNLNTTLGTLNQSSLTTDKNGKATFTLTYNQPGEAQISASVLNANQEIKLANDISVKFK